MRTPKQLFNEIVKLAESVVKVDEVKDVEVQEEVVLAEETQEVQEPVQEELSEQVESQEELAEEPMQDMPVEESPMEDYVSRGEFEAALKEMKEMYTKVLEVMSPESGEDVPADLAQEAGL